MKKIVVKFGGSNLRRPEDIDRIVNVVQTYQRPLVLVVSAFYGITNELIACVQAAKEGAGTKAALADSRNYTQTLRALKKTILEANLHDAEHRARTEKALGERLDQLERYLTGIHCIGDVPTFVNDAILSYGERLSSLLLAEVLQSRGIAAREALPEDIGLITDGVFGNSACDFAASAASVAQALEGNEVIVVPGFYGVDREGKATLFGRGGSDYSAASIACCIGAESLDVWKDVDGFLSADPGTVTAPRSISQLNYLEAAELSYFGAKILHPRTVEPLFDQDIPIRILNITRPERGLQPYTIINAQRKVTKDVVKSVTSTEDVAILKLHGPGVGFKPGILAQVTNTLDQNGINIKSVLTAQTAINILLARDHLDAAYAALKEHHLAGVVDVSRNDEVAIVAVVGDGVLEASDVGSAIASRALSAAIASGVRVTLAAAGASEVAAYMLVHQEDRKKALQAVHAEFFGS
ncbi:aspartate kinase [Undibacterium cyanobacteriorum]|uniref:Aspartokinase n=1 Tax=Undibacterium cyanobacteriorum TaxID=3073561 RepID=A0ABY9RHV9_9BURK|nr:aspartate kinase [Undibacterium sp. 20NA77.5]WMW80811.1 aspartate kinase [Undibacterium sp. 20NA77.5]